jgi:hypothetical protein
MSTQEHSDNAANKKPEMSSQQSAKNQFNRQSPTAQQQNSTQQRTHRCTTQRISINSTTHITTISKTWLPPVQPERNAHTFHKAATMKKHLDNLDKSKKQKRLDNTFYK